MNHVKPHFPEASQKRHEAGVLLARGDTRLRLMLATVILLSLVLLYVTVDSVAVNLFLTLAKGTAEELFWQSVCLDVLLVLLFFLLTLFLSLPLFYGSVYIGARIALGEDAALADLFFAFSSPKRYRNALRLALSTLWRFAILLFFAAVTYMATLWYSRGDGMAILLGAMAILTELILALLLSRGAFFAAYFVYAEGENAKAARRRSRMLARWCGNLTVTYAVDALPALLLSVATAGIWLVADALPRMLLSYPLFCRATAEEYDRVANENQIIQSEEIKTMNEKFYMTTAIAYASRKPHFGNTYEVIMSDAVARYRRACGYDVFFCTGTDEHGQKIENLANEQGITPKKYVDGVAGEIRGIWDGMNTSYDYFIRTTDDNHEKAVQKIFRKFYEKGDIYKGHYEGWYCTPCESFFTATQAEGGKCPDCGRPVVQAQEEAYFFKMSKYADRLMKHIEDNPEFIQPELRKKEMVNNFLKAGLQDLCVSRSSFTWGIPVDFDSKHVVYVWLDALTNYITALGYDPDKSYEEQSEHFRKYWPADVHIIGKDILRFHTIYWPIFLMALDLPLPKQVFGHPWFNFGMDKMSKSKGNVIYADKLAEHFSVDGVRYYALSEMPFASDGSITYESVIKRYNTDLVNNLGNLVKRTLDMNKKYFAKIVPAPAGEEGTDRELKEACAKAYATMRSCMDTYHVADALEAIFEMLSRANKYIDETTPWTLAKDEANKPRLGTVLYNLMEAIRWGAVMLAPFIPATAEEILSELATDQRTFETLGGVEAFGGMKAGVETGDSKVLFARVDEEKKLAEFEAERQAMIAAAQAEEAKPEKPEGCAMIGIEDFMNVELRTAKILACEKVAKAKKLLKLQVDLGYEQRQVVSGIAKWYAPEDLVGKKIILVANLKPATLCGIESNGMILASGEETVRVVFLAEDTPLGERVR